MSILCEPNLAGSFGSEPVLPAMPTLEMRARILAFGSSPSTAVFVASGSSPRAAFTSPGSSARSSSAASPSSFMTPDKVAAYRTLSQHGYAITETGTPTPRPRVTVGFKVQDTLNPPSPTDDEPLPRPAIATAAAVVAALSLDAAVPTTAACATASSRTESLSPSSPRSTTPAAPISSLTSISIPCLPSPPTACARSSISASTSTSARVKKHLAWADEIGNSLSVRVFFDPDAAPSCRTTRTRGRPFPISTPTPSTSVPFPALGSPGSPATPRFQTELENACTVLPQGVFEIATRLTERNVLLESVNPMMHSPLVMLNIRVRNIAFEKRVIVRLTKDCWKSHFDVDASFMPGCLDGGSDRFYATVSVSPAEAEQGVQFALCYRTGGNEYWDNNNGRNYKLFQGAPASSSAGAGAGAGVYSQQTYASPRFSRMSSDTFYA